MKETSRRIIAFSGPKYSGKDTAAKALFALNTLVPKSSSQHKYFQRDPFAGQANPLEGVKGVCALMFGYTEEQMEDPILKETPTTTWPFLAPRFPMMDVANWLRDKYGGDIHVRALERRLDPSYWAHVITDLRFPYEELPWLKANDALIIYVQRDEAEQSLAAKQAAGDEMSVNVSEQGYAKIKAEADYIVDNNGPMHQIQNEVVSIVRKHFGYWGTRHEQEQNKR